MAYQCSEDYSAFLSDPSGWKLSSLFLEKIKNNLGKPAVVHGIIASLADSAAIINGKLEVYDANDNFCRMLGYSYEEMLKLHLWDWEPRFTADEIKQMSKNMKGTKLKMETLQKRSDGTLISVEIHGDVFEYNGEVWQICVCRDKKSKNKIKNEYNKFQLNLNETQKIAHIGSWELDLESDIFICSDEMKRIWDIPQDKNPDKFESLEEKVLPEDWPKVDKAIQDSISKSVPYDIEYRIAGGSGNIKYLHSRTRVLKNSSGVPVRIYGICQDITAQKKYEEDRKLNEIRLLQSQEIAHIGSWEYNIETGTLWWSEELYRIYGIDPKNKITHNRYMEFIHPEDRILFEGQIENANEGYHIEYRIIRPDGEIRYLSTFVGNHEYRDGKRYLIRGTAQDITERTLVEQERNQLELQLHHAQKMETIGTLAGGVAHDINNILGIILGNTELCMDDIAEWNPAYSNLKEIVDAVLRAKGVIRQLLTFSRNMETRKEPVNILSVINDSLKFLRSTVSATIDIEKEINVSSPEIFADATQINQLFLNICVNSAQAMEGSDGLIKIKIENVRVNHPAEGLDNVLANGKYLKIVISDNGPGIPAKIQEKIFDPYFTTKEVGKGSGMGLAVVQGIVKSHKGSINVKSTDGRGTSFTILLPNIIEDSKANDDSTPVNNSDAKKVLFIDDEEAITRIGKRVLESIGYVVDSVTSPITALDMIRENPKKYDLIVTDMAMPRMNALMLFKEIRAVNSYVPVLLSSGHNPLMDPEKAMGAGFAGYIAKPFTKSELTAAVHNVLEKDNTRSSE